MFPSFQLTSLTAVLSLIAFRHTQEAIKVIREYDEEFTILSGGHDYECQSSTKSALIITSLLNKVEFDFNEDNPTVTAGTGVLWSNIYDQLKALDSPYGVMGAQCGLVSVSGYTAGGGYSWHMSRYHGLAAETAIEVKVALADGEIVTATTENNHSDLRWALSGSGGQNLGFVLEWKFRLFPSTVGGYTHSRVEYRFDNIDEAVLDESDRIIYPWRMAREIIKDAVVAADALLDEDDIGKTCHALKKLAMTDYCLRFSSIQPLMASYCSFRQVWYKCDTENTEGPASNTAWKSTHLAGTLVW